jgi:hypothetical protein
VHYYHPIAALLKKTNSFKFNDNVFPDNVSEILLLNVSIIFSKYPLSSSYSINYLIVFFLKYITGKSSNVLVNSAASNNPSLGAV